MRILVTGGAGYIGSNLVVELLNQNHEVIVVDNLVSSSKIIVDNIKKITGKEFTFYSYNCGNENLMNQIFEDHEIEFVIHAAAEVSTVRSTADPIYYYSNNINSLLTILKVMMKHGIKNMIFSSSATLSSESQIKKNIENPYGLSKLMCEDIINSLGDKVNCAILRYFNPIGTHQSGLIGALPRQGSDCVINALFKAYHYNEQFKVYGENYETSDGTCIRDYIHINDLVSAHLKAMHWLIDAKQTNTFNICTGKGYSVKELILQFETIMNHKINTIPVGRRKGDVAELIGNTEKTKNNLNFVAKEDIRKAINDSISWYNYIFDILDTGVIP